MEEGADGSIEPSREVPKFSTSALQTSLLNRWPLETWRKDIVLLAVSGGADSIALLNLIASLAPDLDRIKVVHVNHGLRGAESDCDELFVLEQCLEHGIESFSVRLATEVMSSHSEESLRNKRYAAIQESAEAVGARWIALAHHQDDNIETFLMRLFRGTGMRGLEGIPFSREVQLSHGSCRFVRPLLDTSRESLLAYLEERCSSFRTDSSNGSSAYFRNRIRNELIPTIDELGQIDWKEKIVALMSDIGERNVEVRNRSTSLLTTGVTFCSDGLGVQFSLSLVESNSWEVIRELLVEICLHNKWPMKHLGRKHWDQIHATLRSACQSPHPTSVHLPEGLRLEVRRKQVYLYQIQ